MDVIDRINHRMTVLKKLGIEVRFDDLQGSASGLCELNGRRILLVEVALPSQDQLEIFEQAISQTRLQTSSARRSVA